MLSFYFFTISVSGIEWKYGVAKASMVQEEDARPWVSTGKVH